MRRCFASSEIIGIEIGDQLPQTLGAHTRLGMQMFLQERQSLIRSGDEHPESGVRFGCICVPKLCPQAFELLEIEVFTGEFALCRDHIPDKGGTVPLSGGQLGSIRREGEAGDIGFVALQAQKFLAR